MIRVCCRPDIGRYGASGFVRVLSKVGCGREEHEYVLNRIYIIGAGGAGKSTLARRLGKRLGAPIYWLDTICYIGGRGGIGARYRPDEDRLADVAQIARQDTWIVEGIYLGWTGELLRAADTIVWLDLPWRIADWRILVRHMRRSL